MSDETPSRESKLRPVESECTPAHEARYAELNAESLALKAAQKAADEAKAIKAEAAKAMEEIEAGKQGKAKKAK